MFLTKKHLPRRTFLRGVGASDRAAAARFDDPGAHRAGGDGGATDAARRLHLHSDGRADAAVDAHRR